MAKKRLLTAQELAEIFDLSVDTIWGYTGESGSPDIEAVSLCRSGCAGDITRQLTLKGIAKDQGWTS